MTSTSDTSCEQDICCKVPMIHVGTVREVFEAMPDDGRLFDMAEFFKVFGDSTRVRILFALHQSELCVCDLSALLSMSQSAISHQLRILKNARLVSSRREGKVVYYSLLDDHVKDIIEVGTAHLLEKK